jgi:arylsulfatase A-like enzyme
MRLAPPAPFGASEPAARKPTKPLKAPPVRGLKAASQSLIPDAMKLIVLLLSYCCILHSSFAAEPRPSVLLIAIDDLNDWVGCLGGHPQARTPNIDRLAKRGVLFSNAHCAAPLCNPSRAAVFSGRQPFETGVFANDESNIRKVRPDLVLIPQHFQQAGYHTFGTGKLLHQTGIGLFDEGYFPEQRWSPFAPRQTDYTPAELPSKATADPRHAAELKGTSVVLPLNRMPSDRAPNARGGESFDWGPLEVDDGDMGDGQIAAWAADRLRRVHDKPFFMGVGFYRPHIPLFAPKKYFELYDGLEIKLPMVRDDDLTDLSPTGRKRALEAVTAGAHATVVKHGQWQAAVKAYLACVSFIDAQVGKLLDALDAGPNAGNTLVVLWSDHGWHLGEKQHWGKWTGWQRSTRVPFMIAPPSRVPPGSQQAGARCAEPVGLIDLYPTLIDLCGLPPREGLSGRSLAPLMKNPKQATDRVVITTFDKGNHSLTGARWHYLHYADGAEELYDRESDPNEWTNLATDPKAKSALQEMKTLLARMLKEAGGR